MLPSNQDGLQAGCCVTAQVSSCLWSAGRSVCCNTNDDIKTERGDVSNQLALTLLLTYELCMVNVIHTNVNLTKFPPAS